MPWSPADVDRHKRGLTHGNKIRWANTANATLRGELDAGKTQAEAEATAIRTASSRFKAGKSTKGPTPLSRPVSRRAT